MKAAWDRGEEYYDPARKEEDILGRTKTRLDLWEEHVKDPIVGLAKALECLKNPFLVLAFWFVAWLAVVAIAMACSVVGAKVLQEMWEGPNWEGVQPCLDSWDVVLLRTSSSYWNVPGKYGPHSELFVFLIRKEPVAPTKAVPFKPFVSAEVCLDWFAPSGSR